MLSKITPYTKALIQVLAAVVAALVPFLTSGPLTVAEWINVAIVGVHAISVYQGENTLGGPYTKAVISAVSAALVVLVSVISGGVTAAEGMQIAVAVLGALGVYQVPNAGASAKAAATTPNSQVVVRRDAKGRFVAADAAPQPNGQPVNVVGLHRADRPRR